MNIKVICGAVVIKDNMFVLVKEAQKHVYGKWNFPAGHLDLDEDIFQATLREVKEETNLDIKLDGLIGIYQNKSQQENNVIKFIFKGSVIKGKLKHCKTELLDAKWFTFKEFNNLKDSDLRTMDLRTTIKDYQKKGVQKLNTIHSIDF